MTAFAVSLRRTLSRALDGVHDRLRRASERFASMLCGAARWTRDALRYAARRRRCRIVSRCFRACRRVWRGAHRAFDVALAQSVYRARPHIIRARAAMHTRRWWRRLHWVRPNAISAVLWFPIAAAANVLSAVASACLRFRRFVTSKCSKFWGGLRRLHMRECPPTPKLSKRERARQQVGEIAVRTISKLSVAFVAAGLVVGAACAPVVVGYTLAAVSFGGVTACLVLGLRRTSARNAAEIVAIGAVDAYDEAVAICAQMFCRAWVRERSRRFCAVHRSWLTALQRWLFMIERKLFDFLLCAAALSHAYRAFFGARLHASACHDHPHACVSAPRPPTHLSAPCPQGR